MVIGEEIVFLDCDSTHVNTLNSMTEKKYIIAIQTTIMNLNANLEWAYIYVNSNICNFCKLRIQTSSGCSGRLFSTSCIERGSPSAVRTAALWACLTCIDHLNNSLVIDLFTIVLNKTFNFLTECISSVYLIKQWIATLKEPTEVANQSFEVWQQYVGMGDC